MGRARHPTVLEDEKEGESGERRGPDGINHHAHCLQAHVGKLGIG